MYFLHPARVPTRPTRSNPHSAGDAKRPAAEPRLADTASSSPALAFGARVRALRVERELTQEDLAEHCGLFRTYMSRIETGQANPTLTMIVALADALGVQPAELMPPATATAPARGSNRKLGNSPSRGRVG